VLYVSLGDGQKNFEKETNELLNELAKAGIITKGSVFTMLYNPPYIHVFYVEMRLLLKSYVHKASLKKT
jgi:hypothetical protein